MRTCGICNYPVYDPRDKSECATAAAMFKGEMGDPDPIGGWATDGRVFCVSCFATVEEMNAMRIDRL